MKIYTDNAKNEGPYLMLLNRNHFTFQDGHNCKIHANLRSFIFWCFADHVSQYNLSNWQTYFLTPWCRVLLEKLTGLQLVMKFPAFHGTWRFITALTSVRHLSLSWASPIQSIYPHPTSWRSILILFTHLHLGLTSGSFPPGSQTRPYTPPSPRPYAPHDQPISFFSILSPAQYSVKSKYHLAPLYAISSIPPLPRPS